jgi:hypothetical protein
LFFSFFLDRDFFSKSTSFFTRARRWFLAAAMVSRKRAHSEMEAEPVKKAEDQSLLQKIRNCWEFSSLMQYIFFFGKVMKIDEEFGIEVLSTLKSFSCYLRRNLNIVA